MVLFAIFFFFNATHAFYVLLQLISGEPKARGKKEQCQPEKIEWQEKTASVQHSEKEKEIRDEDKEKQNQREETLEKMVQNASQVEDFERTPSGRVRRRSAQVAVFHLQEIAEDELAKEWGTKRRIKDDLVPDSKRVRARIRSGSRFIDVCDSLRPQ